MRQMNGGSPQNESSPSTPTSVVILNTPVANDTEVDTQPQVNVATIPNACHSDIPLYDSGNVEEVYASSIEKPLWLVEEQFKQILWNRSPVKVH